MLDAGMRIRTLEQGAIIALPRVLTAQNVPVMVCHRYDSTASTVQVNPPHDAAWKGGDIVYRMEAVSHGPRFWIRERSHEG